MSSTLKSLLAAVATVTCLAAGPSSQQNLFPAFPDEYTVVLWPFDETEYPHATLTDASVNEFDLTLMSGGHLDKGRFGQALRVSPGEGAAVSFATSKGGAGPMKNPPPNGKPSGLWGPTTAPGSLMSALSNGNWTIEFWIRLETRPRERQVVIDLGDGLERGFSLELLDQGQRFLVSNTYGGFAAVCGSNALLLGSGNWRHVAFTHEAGLVRHFLDGKLQAEAQTSPLPRQPLAPVIAFAERLVHFEKAGWTWERPDPWRKEHRFNLALGEDRKGQGRIDGALDELRISKVIRYQGEFPLPGSHTYNYGPGAPSVHRANGQPLLFTKSPVPPRPLDLGSRKHLFIDTALLESVKNARVVSNPPRDRRVLNFQPGHSAWRPSVVDVDGKVYMYCPEGYSGKRGWTHLRISEDGVNFETPELHIYENYPDCVLTEVPFYGTFFKDLNPDAPIWARYKLTAWSSQRGCYLYVSPDGIHWRRNQSAMLPIESGGGVETFWDDQLGLYRSYVRRDVSFNSREGPSAPAPARKLCMFETDEITKVWPFRKLRDPYFEGATFPALTGEGPVVFEATEAGQVYRSRAIKYPWAPDTYLAFVWRFNLRDQTRRVDLGTSRDGGTLWRFFAPGSWYVEPWNADEVMSIYGLIRRGDEIWQYVDYGAAHGGGSDKRVYARFTQRLDGFTSLDASQETGTATSRLFTFSGDRLLLNVAARDALRAELRNERGEPLPGFTLTECDPVRTDAIRQTVTWKGNHNVAALAGKPVRLHFEMRDTKLFAMQFCKGPPGRDYCATYK